MQFQILRRNGALPAAKELARKDTVQVRPGETVPLLMPFSDNDKANAADTYHCHVLQHEDRAMTEQFVVIPV